MVAVEDVEGAPWVALDRSAFYPASGGQPRDRGVLAGARVQDVQLRDGRVWHRLDGRAPRLDDLVTGEVDWERRLRHMQRHTAQHLLSQAFLHVDEALATQSVSLSGPECTVDLAGAPTEAALAQAEELVNRVAYADLPIESFEVDEEDLGRYPLRRPPKVRGTIRLVAMGDFEISACGGTHLSGTAQAAPVKVLKAERLRGELTRVTFRAGFEALEDYREKHGVAYGLAVAFSARVGELPVRVRALRDAERNAAAALEATRARLAAALADAWRAQAEAVGETRVVRRVLPPEDAGLLRPVAEALIAAPGTVALLGLAGAAKARVLVGRSADMDLDVRPVLAAALAAVEGKGGGRPHLAQGGGPRIGNLEAALDLARDALPGQP